MEKSLLVSAGFDINWLTQMEVKYSATIFGIITDFLNQGFTVPFIISVIDKCHPLVIDILYQIFAVPPAAAAKFGASAAVLEGAISASLDNAIASDISVFLIQKVIDLLPTLGLTGWKLTVASYGLKILLAYLQTLKPAPVTPAV